MTAILRKRQLQAGGEGILGVHSVNHFVLTVPGPRRRLSASIRLFGLDAVNHRAGYAVRTEGVDHDWGFLSRVRASSCSICPSVSSMRISSVSNCIWSPRGPELLSPPKGFESNGLRFRDYDGNLIELVVTTKTSPGLQGAGRTCIHSCRHRRRATAQQGGEGSPDSACAHPDLHPRCSRRRSTSALAFLAWGCPTARGTTSHSCTAAMAATTTCLPSSGRPLPACTTRVGTCR